jgi:hypothetical protein
MSRLSEGSAYEGRRRESPRERLSFQCPTHGAVRSFCRGTRIATTGSLMRERERNSNPWACGRSVRWKGVPPEIPWDATRPRDKY